MDIALVFPHQLFRPQPAVQRARQVVLLEDPLFFGPDTEWPTCMHRQKLLLHRASMRVLAAELQKAGHAVQYIACPPEGGRTDLLLDKALPHVGRIHVVDPVDDVIRRRLIRLVKKRGASLIQHENPQFLTTPKAREEFLSDLRKPYLARFYQQQRQRLKLLVEDDGSPTGGQWSFDPENRQRLPRGVHPPSVPSLAPHAVVEEARAEIEEQFPEARGTAEGFGYPVTPEQASQWLDDFLRWRLAGFGPYEDAISTRHPVLFHSVLTASLNIGLLTPAEVVERTMNRAAARPMPINSLEGFLRQIIGWREFIRLVYERSGRAMRTRNFWGFRRRLPACFYTATTSIEPVDHTIRQVLRTGYCHHIERLMILGNFFLLCRIHPDDVYRWFMEMFIDSYDWVMVPNVYGMSQFSDGGSFTTKPYLSASHYLRKMSDHPPGPWCEIWDSLYWTFIADHREVFRANHRLKMMVHACDRLGPKLTAHRQTAKKFLAGLGGISSGSAR